MWKEQPKKSSTLLLSSLIAINQKEPIDSSLFDLVLLCRPINRKWLDHVEL